MRSISILTVGAALCLATATVAWAAPITTVPTGLNPGDSYRLAFLTTTGRDATSSEIADYNAFVTAVANGSPELLALGTTWNAIGSTDAVDARDNTGTNPSVDGVGVPIYRLDDVKLVDGNADLWDGSLDAALNVTWEGNVSNVVVWTGTLSTGVAGEGLGGPLAETGFSSQTNSQWIFDNGGTTSATFPLYAMSGVLTVIPEPGTAALLGLGLAFLGGRRRRR